MELHPGDTFDEFEVIEKIGTGAFSDVYLAHDSILDRTVVLKQLSSELSEDDREWDAFINEAQLTASIRHPGVVNVHALRVDEDVPSVVLVLEYMNGGTLDDILDSQGSLDIFGTWNLAFQIGNALDYLHKRGIIHRDIKPANILYAKDTRWFKLSDFGLSFDPRRQEFESLNHGQPGTLRYMSPEQVMNKRIDNRSDQYALAAVIYESLTGHHYLDLRNKATDREIGHQIIHDTPIPLPAINKDADLVEKLNAVLMRGLAKKPSDRYSNIYKFRKDVTRVLDQMKANQKRANSGEAG